MMNLLQPLDAMPLVELTPQFIAGLRDKMAANHGRRMANYVMAVVSVACEHGKEQGYLKDNPVKASSACGAIAARLPPTGRGLKPNGAWCSTEAPVQLRVPIALAMFTGLRKGDILKLTKTAIRDGKIWRRTNKTGQAVSIPVHPDLAQLLAAAPPHDAITIAATTNGTPWTASGFNSTFIKAIARLEKAGAGRRWPDVPRPAPHRRHAADRSWRRHRHGGAAVARPEDAGDGDPLFRDGRHVGQDAGNNECARPARDQTPNKSV